MAVSQEAAILHGGQTVVLRFIDAKVIANCPSTYPQFATLVHHLSPFTFTNAPFGGIY